MTGVKEITAEALHDAVVRHAMKTGALPELTGTLVFPAAWLAVFNELTRDVALALNGDERLQLHLEAQFSQRAFGLEAGAFLHASQWTQALMLGIAEVVSATASVAITIASAGLVQALKP